MDRYLARWTLLAVKGRPGAQTAQVSGSGPPRQPLWQGWGATCYTDHWLDRECTVSLL